MSGFYLMHRGWQDHPVFRDEPYTERSAWIWLIEGAAWRPCRKRVGGLVVDLARGQHVGSVRQLADMGALSKIRVDEFRDYWHGVPGTRGCKLDWEATWRNRCREVAGRGARGGQVGRDRQQPDGIVAALRSLRID